MTDGPPASLSHPADPAVSPSSRRRGRVLVLNRWAAPGCAALLIFFTCGYFQNSRPGWNVNSQFGLTAAIAERGTLRIDLYHNRPETETGDKAFFEGHYYSDKSPVTAFLGVPAFWAYAAAVKAMGRAVDYDAARYWVTWLTIGAAAAVLAGLLTGMLQSEGVPPARAARAGALWIAATPLLTYAILFFNYLPACAMALGGLLLTAPAWRPDAAAPACTRLLLGGLLLGLAAWTLNTMALAALVVAVGLAAGLIRRERSAGGVARAFAPWALGCLLGVAGQMGYTLALFGEVASPYAYEADPFFREQMARGFMGATRPRAWVAWLVTFHPFQGLFLWFPIVLVALLGVFARLAGKRAGRTDALIALAIFAGLLLYNSAYFMWWGGWAYAPRHLIPALPFLASGLAGWLGSRRRAVRRAVLGLALIGAVFNVAALALDPQPPPGLLQEELMAPEMVDAWPSPFLALQRYVWLGNQTDNNWGTALGLTGWASLVPLWIVWGVALILFGRLEGPRRGAAERAAP